MCMIFVMSGHEVSSCGELATFVDPAKCLYDDSNPPHLEDDDCLCYISAYKVAKHTGMKIVGDSDVGNGFEVRFEAGPKDKTTLAIIVE